MAKTQRRFSKFNEDEYSGRFVREQQNRSNRLPVRQLLRDTNIVDEEELYIEDVY